MKKTALFCWIFWLFFQPLCQAEEAYLEKSVLKEAELQLRRFVHPSRYFDTVGRKSAVLGRESGAVEIWIYPYKVIQNLQLYFLIEEENQIVEGRDIAHRIDLSPHQAVIHYVHSSFKVEETFFTPLNESGAIILFSVETIKPLSVVVSFTPELKPMWPAGLGGQYSLWDAEKKSFVISEGTRKNLALIGSPYGERFSTGPAHALPEGDMKIKIPVEPQTARKILFPVFISASTEGRKGADAIYTRLENDFKELYSEKFLYHEKLAKDSLSIQTPVEHLNTAFQWAKVAVDSALVCNPQLGCGLVAGYGLSGRSERPGFAWFFGGDAFFNSWALNSYGSFEVTHQALTFIRKNQREDGKIMHELSQGAAFIPWFDEYPYGYYHAETTPYYIISIRDYLLWSGDMEFIQECWSSIKKAYQYILTADTDSDGLMENTVAGLAALELGAFLKNTKTDIYLAALSVESHRAFSKLAVLMKEENLSRKAAKTYEKALQALQEKFWIDDKKSYAHAITIEDKPLDETTVWPSMPLFFNHIPLERADFVLDLLASSEMSTDWGVRSLSPKSSSYDPLNYNYGTVWPFLTGYTCLSEYNYGRSLAGFSHLMSLAHNTFIDALGYCAELFSGDFFAPLETSVPHQIFSSSPVANCLIRGLLGLSGNALQKEITFRPNLPGGWKDVDAKNFRVGKDIFHFSIQRIENRFICEIEPKTASNYLLHFQPLLGFGTQILAVSINGKEGEFAIEEIKGTIRCLIDVEVSGKTLIEIKTDKSILLDFPLKSPKLGDKTTGLKIMRAIYGNNQLKILCEGLGGWDYTLSLITDRLLVAADGAEVEDRESRVKKLRIKFQEQEENYLRKEIVLRFD